VSPQSEPDSEFRIECNAVLVQVKTRPRLLPRFQFVFVVTAAAILAAHWCGSHLAAIADNPDSGSRDLVEASSIDTTPYRADSGESTDAGTSVLQEIRNDAAPFAVHVGVDHADAKYAIGDLIRVSVRSERDGYLYLLWVDSASNISCVFPNNIEQSNRIKADEEVSVPAAGSGYKLRIAPPTGNEILKAIVTESPLQSMQHDRLIGGEKTALSFRDMRLLKGETGIRADWAESDVAITTVPAREAASGRHRHGIFIGVSQHADSRIPPRPASAGDAGRLAEAFREKGGLETSEVVIDEKVTRQYLQTAIMASLRKSTSPGDTIFITWSGPVALVADDDGDEAGGCDAVFLPYEAHADDDQSLRSSGIVDDEIFRWLQDLDGRTVLLVLDGCDCIGHSRPVDPSASARGLLGHEIDRLGKLGHNGIAVIAATRPGETALVKTDGSTSEFSSLLAARVQKAGSRLSLQEAFAAISEPLSDMARSRNTPATPSITGDGDAVLLVTGTGSSTPEGAK